MNIESRKGVARVIDRRSGSMTASFRSLTTRSSARSLRAHVADLPVAVVHRVADLPVAVVHAIRPLLAAPSMLSILLRRAALDLPFVFPRDSR